MLLISTEHVYSVNVLSLAHPKMKILPHLCLELPVQKVYLPRPECAAVEIDWQLLSPVTADPALFPEGDWDRKNADENRDGGGGGNKGDARFDKTLLCIW